MDVVAAAGAAVAGALVSWFAVGFQHLLYKQPEFRSAPLSGRRKRTFQLLAALAGAAACGIAFRPDFYDPGPATLAAAFALVLVVLSSTDFERRLIPNFLVQPATVVALAFAWAWPDRSIADIALGTAVAAVIAVLVFVAGRASSFGAGDVKLIVLLGAILGWPAVLPALFLGVVVAGGYGLVLVVRGQARSYFAYGPFLALGGLAALLWPDRFS